MVTLKYKISSIIKSFILLFVSTATLFSSSDLKGQNFVKRYWSNLISDTSDVSKPKLLVYPVVAYAPETSWEFGLSSLYVYYAKRDTTNRLSEVNSFTFFTLENQYGVLIDHANYTDNDKWFFLGGLRFQSFPLFYHGIGIDTPEDYIARVDANQIILKERVLRKVCNNLFVGLEVDYQRLSSVKFIDRGGSGFELPRGSEGTTNLGFGLGIVQDNRHNVLNVRDGFFSELAFLNYNTAWGSSYDFTALISDTRIYRPMSKNNVLAAQFLGQFNFGDVPFNQLALMGGENMMRGYYRGRYRDNHQLATQVEYRFLPLPLGFTKRIGATVFAGAGSIFDKPAEFNFSDVIFSGGAGLRFLLFPDKDIYTRIDLAFTEEGTGFYIFIGEAF